MLCVRARAGRRDLNITNLRVFPEAEAVMRLFYLALTAQLLAAVTAASSQQGLMPNIPPAFGADGGTANASTSNVNEINEALGSVVAVESGRSTAPLPVQEAFLASMKNDSTKIEGAQTVRPTHCLQPVLPHFP